MRREDRFPANQDRAHPRRASFATPALDPNRAPGPRRKVRQRSGPSPWRRSNPAAVSRAVRADCGVHPSGA